MLDAIIVGQGIAGSLLALKCLKMKLNVIVIDNNHRHSSTKIAAGIMNPFVGPRLTPLWPSYKEKSFTIHTYRWIESMLGTSVLMPHRLIRFLSSPQECRAYQSRQCHPWSRSAIHPTGDWSSICQTGTQQFENRPVYRINTPNMLRAVKDYLVNQDRLIHTDLHHKDVHPSDTHIEWQGLKAASMVFCEGSSGECNPFFNQLTFNNAHGHVLFFKCKDLDNQTILNHGRWICPLGNNEFMYGATAYHHINDQSASQQKLEQSLQDFLKVPYTKTKIVVGIRPRINQYYPPLVFESSNPRLICINGFRGQGMLHAPFMAKKGCQFVQRNAVAKLP